MKTLFAILVVILIAGSIIFGLNNLTDYNVYNCSTIKKREITKEFHQEIVKRWNDNKWYLAEARLYNVSGDWVTFFVEAINPDYADVTCTFVCFNQTTKQVTGDFPGRDLIRTGDAE